MTTAAPLVSIVMPNYNNEEFLPETMGSIQRQILDDYELIVCQNLSQDNSLGLLKGFRERDQRIRIIESDSNRGCAYAYNVGIDNARGKYIAIMDSDDIMMPERLRTEVDFLDNNPGTSMVCGLYQHFGRDNSISKKPSGHSHIATGLLHTCCFGNAMTVRREFFERTGLRYDENLAITPDYKLFLEALLQNKYPARFTIMNHTGIRYRVHESNTSISRASLKKHCAERIAVGDFVSNKLYPQDSNYEMLRNTLQYDMNGRYLKHCDCDINTDYINLGNLRLWRDATVQGLLKYQDLDADTLRAAFNRRIASMMFKKLKGWLGGKRRHKRGAGFSGS